MKTLITGTATSPHSTEWQSIKPKRKIALQLCWTGLTGTLNATIELHLSLDRTEITIAHIVTITTATNAGDRLLLELETASGFYKLVYTPGGVTGGTIKILSEEE